MLQAFTQLVHIPADDVHIEGMLELPDNARGLVIFAHGSGSSRHSIRNNYVAKILRNGAIGTLLIDLLTEEEDTNDQARFDIPLLTRRLLAATRWIKAEQALQQLPIGYFGASTGAAAALQATALLDNQISAVVSRGGRPDMADIEDLNSITCPTLLLVGGLDDIIIALNNEAYRHLHCTKHIAIIPGATHLFEEPGALEKVASLACDWFRQYLPA